MTNKELFLPKGSELITKNDGNIIRFDFESVQNIKKILRIIKDVTFLTSNQKSLLEAVAVMPIAKERDYITYQDINDILDVSRNALSKRFKTLKDLGFVSISVFDRTKMERIGGKCLCVEFVPVAQITPILNSLREEKEDLRLEKEIIAKSKLSSDFKKTHNIHAGLVNDFKTMPIALMPKKLFVFESCAVPKGIRKTIHQAKFQTEHGVRQIETDSVHGVFAVEDIQVLYALITLTINQWANIRNYLEATNELPPKQNYIAIIDIIKILGLHGNQNDYKNVRDSMRRIITTNFTSQDGESMFVETLGDEFYSAKSFRFFNTNTVYLSKDKSEVKFDDLSGLTKFDIKPHAYYLSWEDNLYQRFITDDFFFNIPLDILAAKPYIFLLYMFLRVKFSSNPNQVIDFTITDIYNKILKGRGSERSELKEFKKELFRGLIYQESRFGRYDMGKLPEGSAAFNLSGFIVMVSHTNGAIDAISCQVDQHQMLKACGVLSDTKGFAIDNPTVAAAPQSKNPMKILDSAIRSRAALGEKLPTELNMRLIKNELELSPKKVGSTLIMKNPLDSRVSVEFNAYSDNSDIMIFTESFSNHDLKSAAVFERIKKLITGLPLLKDGLNSDSSCLTRDVFEDILLSIFKIKGIIVERLDLYNILKNSSQLRKMTINHWVNENDKSGILASIDLAIQDIAHYGRLQPQMFQEQGQSDQVELCFT